MKKLTGIAATVINPEIEPRQTRWPVHYRLLTRLGVISYGMYLWHEPILLALDDWVGLVRQTPDSFVQDTAVVLAISVAAGGLSYLLIQRPADQLLRTFGVVVRPGAFATVVEASKAPGDRYDVAPEDPSNRDPVVARHLTLLADGHRGARSSSKRSSDTPVPTMDQALPRPPP